MNSSNITKFRHLHFFRRSHNFNSLLKCDVTKVYKNPIPKYIIGAVLYYNILSISNFIKKRGL